MIRWYEKLYVDKKVGRHLERAKKSVKKAKVTCPYVCICLPSNSNNYLDIIDGRELTFPYYQKRYVDVVGLAVDRESALELVRCIVEEMMEEDGSLPTGFDEQSFHE